jgi:hypothetical protein
MGIHVLVPSGAMLHLPEVLHDGSQQCTVLAPYRQSRANLIVELEESEVSAEAAMVTLAGLLQSPEVAV